MSLNVLVLGGGDSPEREVSLRSAAAVAVAARAANFKVTESDPVDGMHIFDGISAETIILPILHGAGGEDGVLQAEMERRGLAFLGSGSSSSAKCFDKWKTREILSAAGVPLAEGALVDRLAYESHSLKKRPHVLKTPQGGSSIGTLVVRNPEDNNSTAVDQIFEINKEAVLEELIEGTETTVPILDNSALTPLEIIPPAGDEFDYENKYNGRTAELCPPQNISEQVQSACQQLAVRVHIAMDCRHLSRVDIMLDKLNNPYVLEINTIPGLTDQSLYPKSAAVAGMDMPRLVKRFVEMVKRDYKIN